MDEAGQDIVANGDASNKAAVEIRSQLQLPGTRYKVPLAELVSKIVAANEPEYSALQDVIVQKPDIREDTFDALNIVDWEKALYDEANFQFSAKHRPLVEAVLNGVDSELRKEVRTFTHDPKKEVQVDITEHGFTLKDTGEGMNLDTVLTKLLVPKLTGNMTDKADVIGRFGVGFYSLLSYLKDTQDGVVVRTTNGREGWRISIGKAPSEHEERGTLSVVISPLSEKERYRLHEGTEVEIHAKGFDKKAATAYLTDTLQYKSEAAIMVNGEKINDTTSFDQLRYYTKDSRQAIRLLRSPTVSDTAQVALSVGGVKVESFLVTGFQLPETVVLDLPSNTALPKSRDKVEINEDTVKAVTAVIDGISLTEDNLEAAQLFTALAPVVTTLQERNPSAKRGLNMDMKLRDTIKTWATYLPSDAIIVPSTPDVGKLSISGLVPMHKDYMPRSLALPGYPVATEFASKKETFYWAPFNGDAVLAVLPGAVIGNETYQSQAPQNLGMLNALLKTQNKVAHDKEDAIQGAFEIREEKPMVAPTTKAEKTVAVQAPIVGEHSEGENGYEPTDLEMFINTFYQPNEEKIGYVYDAELQKSVRISHEGYTPTSVEDFRRLWLNAMIAEQITLHGIPEYASNYYPDMSFSEDVSFWQEVIDEDFYEKIEIYRTKGLTQEDILQSFPENIRTNVEHELQNYPNQLSFVVTTVYAGLERNGKLSEADKKRFAKGYLIWQISDHLEAMKAVYDDDALLDSLTAQGAFAPLAHELFSGYFREGTEGLEGFYGGDSLRRNTPGIATLELAPMFSLATHEKRMEYLEWLDRNKKELRALSEQENVFRNGISFYSLLADGNYLTCELNVAKDIYQDLYMAGIDDARWQGVEKNLMLMEELAKDDRALHVFFLNEPPPQISPFRGPDLRFLLAGEIREENLEVIMAHAETISDVTAKYDYSQEALAYAHLPGADFTSFNELLHRVYTEQDPAITAHIGTSRAFFINPAGHTTAAWNVMDYAPEAAAARAYADTPELLAERVALLSEYPAEFTRAYNYLLATLMDPRTPLPRSEYLAMYQKYDEKLVTMFEKLFEMPQQDAVKI